jgi:predicted nucleotidyltransferase
MLNRLQDVFRSFQEHDVKYVVIGGIASILYGVPRATFDLDILIEAAPGNTRRLLDALLDAGLGTASLTTVADVLANEITIFRDRVRVDVQTSTPGITFDDAWQHRKTMSYHGQKFFILSKQDLIASKRAAGRNVDIEDVRLLDLPESKGAEQSIGG